MAGLEVRTVAAAEAADIALVAVHRSLGAVAALHTAPAVVVPRTDLVKEALRTDLVGAALHIALAAGRRIDLEVVHHTGPAEEAAGPIAVADEAVELHTGLEVVLHTG